MPPDFSSLPYWTSRFTTESSFEWLCPSSLILPLALEQARHVLSNRPRPSSSADLPCRASLHVLHFGCGTSDLGTLIRNSLQKDLGDLRVEVLDTDFAPTLPARPPTEVPLANADLLSPTSMGSVIPDGGWDILIDKSTADAIACGPLLPDSVTPLETLCRNLAEATRLGGRWICISYSAMRFADLHDEWGWRVVSKERVCTTYLPEGRVVRDEKAEGGERRVYEPETGVWGYVLERI